LDYSTEEDVVGKERKVPFIAFKIFLQIATVQTISGTGALRVAADFINRFLPGKEVYFPDPTWGNHNVIFKDAGVKTIKSYRYYDPKTVGLNINGLLEDLKVFYFILLLFIIYLFIII
jgi:aspartate/tyrosine/aromatic aminotransferase